MSGPPARRPIVAAIYIATLPLNTGEPPEKIATKPKPPEKNPTSKRTRRTVGPSQFVLVKVSPTAYATTTPPPTPSDAPLPAPAS